MTRPGEWNRARPGRKAERCACAGRAPWRLGGSAPRVCGRGSGLLPSLSLGSRLRGTRPQSPDPARRLPRGPATGARRFGALAGQRRVASPGWARVLLHGSSGYPVGRPCALSPPNPLRSGTEPLCVPGSSNFPPRVRRAQPLPRRARLPAQGLPGREGAGRPGPARPARRLRRLVWLDGVFFLLDTYVAYTLRARTYVHHVRAWCRGKSEEGVRSPGAGITRGYELPRGCQRPNPCLYQS